ncbi:glycosyltransferase family 2 protein [Salinisphaera sp.]|uniref:glycosyltransferase family 2 protein n=1 Tax=Salinisphaera sp. TaxID=1914330 RepID=UPI002D764E1D|nr:glycosyltransferase family 2 protein [Salinisphaera sp.]HET7314556.1 glycosyltransferase family 2 protein [Salinisphaera sp.]
MSRSEPESGALPTDSSLKVSAIVPTHNRARYLAEALDSLLHQQRPLDEIIVVDDASTDKTAEVLADYKDRARVVELTTNHGKAAALNMAIPMARGDYLWLFDDDDVALPDALSRHVELLIERDDIDFTYSSTYHTHDPDHIWNSTAWHANELPDIEPERFLLETMRSMNTLMQGMLIPRRALLEIGLFDTELSRCQDLDMLIRLGARYRGAKLDKPTFVYREHDGARGGGQYTHTVEQRFRIQDKYRKQVFRKVRNALPLEDYLTHVGDDSVLQSKAARGPAALIQRGCILLRQGLVKDGLADLESALGDPAIVDIDDAWIAQNLTLALDVEPWMFDDPRAVGVELANMLARHNALVYARPSIRGLYWSMRRELNLRRTRQAVHAGVILSSFTVHCVGQYVRRSVIS